MTLVDFGGKRTEFEPLPEPEIYPSQAPALNFIETILGQATNGSPGDLGLASMEIIEAACESAQTGRNEIIRAVRAGAGEGVKKSPAGKPASSSSRA
jgi:predicted dehydrogenase